MESLDFTQTDRQTDTQTDKQTSPYRLELNKYDFSGDSVSGVYSKLIEGQTEKDSG